MENRIFKIKSTELLKNEKPNLDLYDSIIKEVNFCDIKDLCFKYFNVDKEPMLTQYCYGIYFTINNVEILGGFAIYTSDYSIVKSNLLDNCVNTNELLQLKYGVCNWFVPKNCGSYFINKTIDNLKSKRKYKIITSLVDPAFGEFGIIYQSLGWYYVGSINGKYIPVDNSDSFSILLNDKIYDKSEIINKFGTYCKTDLLNINPNIEFIPKYRKLRYFKFIGNKYENKEFLCKILPLVQEYPKVNENIAGLIYKITNKINNMIYIGQTTRGFKYRIEEYKNGVGCNDYLKHSFTKYGFSNFKFEIIHKAETIDELNKLEIYYIDKYNSQNRKIGYNIENGGKNSFVSDETREKLSKARKGKTQNENWVNKRVEQVSKKVIKVNLLTNVILEEYTSLANASKCNKDGLSYSTLNRKCLFNCKNERDSFWCYYDDYISNNIKEYKFTNSNGLSSLSKEKLNEIKIRYNNGESIRSLSNEYLVGYSQLNMFLTTKEKEVDDRIYVLKCIKTNKIFTEINNKSGAITKHIVDTYKITLPSTFKRKQIELRTGKYWFEEYFIRVYK